MSNEITRRRVQEGSVINPHTNTVYVLIWEES